MLLSGLRKLPPIRDVVFRALDSRDFTDHFVAGGVVEWAAFSSTALAITASQLDDFGYNRRTWEHGLLLAIEAADARCVTALSLFPHEAEALLLPGWRGVVSRTYPDASRAAVGALLGLDTSLCDFTVAEVQTEGLPPRRGILVDGRRQQLQAHLESNPGDAFAHAQAALAAGVMNDRIAQGQHLAAALKLSSSSSAAGASPSALTAAGDGFLQRVRRQYAQFLYAYGNDSARAVALLRETIDANPADVASRVALSAILQRGDAPDVAAAEALLVDALSVSHRRSVPALLNLAALRFERASQADASGAASGDDAAVRVERNLSHLRAARRLFARAVQLEPENAAARTGLGCALGAIAQCHDQHAAETLDLSSDDDVEGGGALSDSDHGGASSDDDAGAAASSATSSSATGPSRGRVNATKKKTNKSREKSELESERRALHASRMAALRQQASVELNAALRLDPNCVQAHVSLARLCAADDFAVAERHIARALVILKHTRDDAPATPSDVDVQSKAVDFSVAACPRPASPPSIHSRCQCSSSSCHGR